MFVLCFVISTKFLFAVESRESYKTSLTVGEKGRRADKQDARIGRGEERGCGYVVSTDVENFDGGSTSLQSGGVRVVFTNTRSTTVPLFVLARVK